MFQSTNKEDPVSLLSILMASLLGEKDVGSSVIVAHFISVVPKARMRT